MAAQGSRTETAGPCPQGVAINNACSPCIILFRSQLPKRNSDWLSFVVPASCRREGALVAAPPGRSQEIEEQLPRGALRCCYKKREKGVPDLQE